jgi:diaminopimelate epimerase
MREILKIEAAGNDFIFFDIQQGVPTSGRIQALCDRHFGIGADGFVVMENLDASHTRWQFFNSDGSHAAMCGNAARAAGAWVKHEGHSFPHHLETDFGEVILGEHVVREPHGFTARIPYAKRPLHIREIATDVSHDTTGLIAGSARLVDTGVPHAVIELKESVLTLAQERREVLKAMAAKFRWAKEAAAGGANVTYFSRIETKAGAAGSVESVTFERGVEDLTLACGTGVLAAALVASGVSPEARTVTWPKIGFEVRTPGSTLWVESEDFPSSLTLVGPANIVFSAKLISSR